MTIRIATFNTENLFRRPKVFRLPSDKQRREILDDYAELVSLLEKKTYDDITKARIAELLKKHRVHDSRKDRPFFVNETRGKDTLFDTTGSGENIKFTIVAKGRPAWTGWVELVRDDLDWEVVHNTGRVIAEIDADILLTVEVEDRTTLRRFNEQVLGADLKKTPYPYDMVIDGNDPRGIDVGILSRHPITSMRSHVFDPDPDRPDKYLFSRDCPEYEIQIGGPPLWLLGNHLKSQSDDNPELRIAQARRVASIYQAALERSPHVIVAGDLNDEPSSEAIRALLGTGLRDVMSHPGYRGTPGTHGTGKTESQKLDYLMLPPPLWDQVQHVEVERRGVWAPSTIKSFDSVTSKWNRASDHAAVYVDLDL
ncbi:endonuclease/exonuclease/phosphatase family protein [Streptomyces tuirus]|uniref:Endonuclease/exonuclease/phosphatase family protein n=1 Tax=Streptomyces tuirus TaxID=68278 RepID=A0A941J2H8_9ACTN|nr:endonuclease/exonuclease/phosphatase family protein [Streptomyces tuirus]